MKKLYFDILDEKRRDMLRKISVILGKGYYLAGGTALAIQIRHRESYDFDVFCDKAVSFAVKRKLFKGLAGHSLSVLVDTSDELTVTIDKRIKLTVLNYFWKPIFPLVRDVKVMPLLSIKDIAAAKAYALGRRGNYRDYFDLYAIIKNGLSDIKSIIKWCEKKYGELFSERMFLEQLGYMEDIQKDEKLVFLDEKYISPKQLGSFFRKEINKYKKRSGGS